MPKIKYTNWGLASRIGDTIYLNKELINEPWLFKSILSHEKKHSSGWDFRDFLLDARNNEIKGNRFNLYKFIIKHPKTLTQLIPFGIYEGRFALDPSLILMWAVVIIIIILMKTWVF